MFKYDVGVYKDKEGNRVKITELIYDEGYQGYNIELIDQNNEQLYNLMEEEVDDILNI